MVLRNLMGWHLVDMTYIPDDRTGGEEGPTGVVRNDSSPFDELPKDVQDKIDEFTVLDSRLYDAAVVAFEKVQPEARGHRRGGEGRPCVVRQTTDCHERVPSEPPQ
ncbi:unnamed protein product [Ectocarpus sp. 12 AP-2014]